MKKTGTGKWVKKNGRRGVVKKTGTVCARLVIPPGLEPGTYSLEGCCSIQLSYGTNNPCRGGKIRTCDLLLPKQAR